MDRQAGAQVAQAIFSIHRFAVDDRLGVVGDDLLIDVREFARTQRLDTIGAFQFQTDGIRSPCPFPARARRIKDKERMSASVFFIIFFLSMLS